MKPIKVKENFSYNGVFYFAGDAIEDKLPTEIINKLNEKGYIEPLSVKEMADYEKPKKENKEVK